MFRQDMDFFYIELQTCIRKKGGPVHEAPAIVGSGEGSMYAALPPHAERLFPWFKPVTSRSQWSNLTVTPRLNSNVAS